jgi:hypothetical protein
MTLTSRGGHRKSIQLIKAHPLHLSESVGVDDLEQIEERLREVGGSVQNERAGSIG